MSAGHRFRTSRNIKVAPQPDTNDAYELFQSDLHRHIGVQHINPRDRDDVFKREMEVYSRCKQNGWPSALVPHLQRKSQSAAKDLNPPKLEDDKTSVNIQASNRVHMSSKIDEKNNLEGNADQSKVIESNLNNNSQSEHGSDSHQRFNGSSNVRGLKDINKSQNIVPNADLRNSDVQNVHIEELNVGSVDFESTLQSNRKSLKGDIHSSNKDHQTIFFIHGVGGSSDLWRAQLDYFSWQEYEIIAPDLIGHGLSCAPDKQKQYHFSEILHDLEEIFDKYCKRKNVIVGHSYGCAFATILARKHPRRVSHLVLISGGGPIPLAPQPGVFSLPICILACFRPCLESSYKKSAFIKPRQTMLRREHGLAIPMYVLSHIMKGQNWPDGDALYHNWLDVPTLLIYGRQDKLVSLDEELAMEEAIYRSQLRIVDTASHMVMVEAPEEVNQLIDDFVNQSQARTGEPRVETATRDNKVSVSSIRSSKSLKFMAK